MLFTQNEAAGVSSWTLKSI